jgi:hypothetical protein
MLQIEGKLVVRQIKGRKGVFAVGELVSAVGCFKIKDSILDQFDEGEYRGAFQVSRIFPDSYIYHGRVVTEIRAQLADFTLDEEIAPIPPDGPAEPDPVERDQADRRIQPSGAPAPDGDGSPSEAVPTDAPSDLKLFGADVFAAIEAWQMVKLDPTIDRQMFREQRDRLKALGYRFDATSQSWAKSAS